MLQLVYCNSLLIKNPAAKTAGSSVTISKGNYCILWNTLD